MMNSDNMKLLKLRKILKDIYINLHNIISSKDFKSLSDEDQKDIYNQYAYTKKRLAEVTKLVNNIKKVS